MASPYSTPVEIRNRSRLNQAVREDDSDLESSPGREMGSLRRAAQLAGAYGQATPAGMAAKAAVGNAAQARGAAAKGGPLTAGGGAEQAAEQGVQLATGRAITAMWIAIPESIFHSAYVILAMYGIGWMAKKMTGKSPFPSLGGGLMPMKAGAGGAAVASAAKYGEGIALFVCLLIAGAIDLLIAVIIYALLNPLETAIKLLA